MEVIDDFVVSSGIECFKKHLGRLSLLGRREYMTLNPV